MLKLFIGQPVITGMLEGDPHLAFGGWSEEENYTFVR